MAVAEQVVEQILLQLLVLLMVEQEHQAQLHPLEAVVAVVVALKVVMVDQDF